MDNLYGAYMKFECKMGTLILLWLVFIDSKYSA